MTTGPIVQTTEPRELVALGQAAQLLASSESFEDIKSIRDAAIAAQAYVKAARRGLEAQNRAAVIRIQAERKAGKWLTDLKLRGGDRKSKSKGRRAPLKLEHLGITRDESKRWQREASVSEEDFQKYVATSNQLCREVSSAGLIRIARGYVSTSNGKPHKSASAQRLAVPSTARNVAISYRQSNGSSRPKELIHEIENHRQLLASMLTPICTDGDAKLKPAECKHLKYLLLQIEKGLKKLNELV